MTETGSKLVRAPRAPEVVEVEIPGTGVMFPGFKVRHPLAPKPTPGYVFDTKIVEEVRLAWGEKWPILAVGDAGFGKSSLFRELYAVMGRPFRRLNLNGEAGVSQILGKEDLRRAADGSAEIRWVDGVVPQCVRGGYGLCVDEWSAALQPVLFAFQWLLEDAGRLVILETGEEIIPHPDFRLFATDNVMGIAERNRHLYPGTNRISAAAIDRFGWVLDIRAPEKEVEFQIVRAHIKNAGLDVSDRIIEGIVRVAAMIRDEADKERVSFRLSTRRCIQWAKACSRFHPSRAARGTILNKLRPADFLEVEKILQRTFGSTQGQATTTPAGVPVSGPVVP